MIIIPDLPLSLQVELCLIVCSIPLEHFNIDLFFMEKSHQRELDSFICITYVQQCSFGSWQHICIPSSARWLKPKSFNKSFLCCFLWLDL